MVNKREGVIYSHEMGKEEDGRTKDWSALYWEKKSPTPCSLQEDGTC